MDFSNHCTDLSTASVHVLAGTALSSLTHRSEEAARAWKPRRPLEDSVKKGELRLRLQEGELSTRQVTLQGV